MNNRIILGAAICIVDPVDKAVLLFRRTDGQGWCCSGGKVEEGEHPLEAALREFNEETGIPLYSFKRDVYDKEFDKFPVFSSFIRKKTGEKLYSASHIFVFKRRRAELEKFLGDIDCGDLETGDGELDRFAWVDKVLLENEFIEKLFAPTEKVLNRLFDLTDDAVCITR